MCSLTWKLPYLQDLLLFALASNILFLWSKILHIFKIHHGLNKRLYWGMALKT